MSAEWTGLEAVIQGINSAEFPAAQMQACMLFMLAMVKLDTSDMSDAIQEAFLLHESLSAYERGEIVSHFDQHLMTLKN